MKNHGIQVMVGNDDADLRKVRAAKRPQDENREIHTRLDEIEKRVTRQGGLIQSIAKMVVAAGLYHKYVQTHGRLR